NLVVTDPVGSGDAVVGWGFHAFGQLGSNTTIPWGNPYTTPSVVPLLAAHTIAAGLDFSLIVKSDNTLVASGGNSTYQLGMTPPASSKTFIGGNGLANIGSVAAGRTHG